MNKIINEFEYLANKIIDDKEGIYLIFLASLLENGKHYYFICSKNDKLKIKHVFLENNCKFDNIKDFRKKYLNNIKISNSERRIRSLIDYAFNYDFENENIIYNNEGSFYCFLPSNNKFLSFPLESLNVKDNGFYDFINYLFIYSNLDNNYFKRKENEHQNIMDKAILLDDKIAYYIKNNSSNIKYRFNKKMNKEKYLKPFIKECNDLCSMMSNYELVLIMTITDYVYMIGNAINKIKPENLYWEGILNNKKIRYENIYNLINNKEFIYNTNLTDDEKENIIKNLEIDHQINMIMENMNNKEIMELASKTNNWNAKLSIMKYIHDEE